jgi:hypothetical protein
MPRRRRTLLHGLLLSVDSGIRVPLGHPFSVVNTLLICLVFLVTALGGVLVLQFGSQGTGRKLALEKRFHVSG